MPELDLFMAILGVASFSLVLGFAGFLAWLFGFED
jgi:hypothetical protein|tara:strand:+ start:754 stop:858 length:105 start_codon:yes stop_codon:yes gene_type:complete